MLHNKIAISSVSLGQHASHTLPLKITAAAEAGIHGIEIIHPDLDGYAKGQSITILQAARKIRQLCHEERLEIIAFAPFENFEGQQTPLVKRLQLAREWLTIAHHLGAEHLQVPSSYARNANGDRNVIVSELRQLSDIASEFEPAIKVAYENLGWGTHVSLWEHALQIVNEVGRENFGLCLDSFHFTVNLWADPFSKSGILPNGDKQLADSLTSLVRHLPLEKLFYLQLSDGEHLDQPYSESHPWYDSSLEPGHVWSSQARPFPLEKDLGGYMPVKEVAQAFLLDLGWNGWVSMETFDRRMKAEQQGPILNAKRAVKSWEVLRWELSQVKTKMIPGKL